MTTTTVPIRLSSGVSSYLFYGVNRLLDRQNQPISRRHHRHFEFAHRPFRCSVPLVKWTPSAPRISLPHRGFVNEMRCACSDEWLRGGVGGGGGVVDAGDVAVDCDGDGGVWWCSPGCLCDPERKRRGRAKGGSGAVGGGVSAPERINGKGKRVMMLDPKVIPAPVESASGGGGWELCWRSMVVCLREGEVNAARNARRRMRWPGQLARVVVPVGGGQVYASTDFRKGG